MNYGFVIDNRKCIGCHACSTACKSENDVALGVYRTWVKYTEVGLFPDVTRQFQVTRCNHCEKPPCVDICPVTAMYKRDDGIVEFDGDACIGCKACMQACPYDAIHIDPNTGTAAKCHYCAHRVDRGLEPACVVVCPEHAILAGDMDDPNSEIAKALSIESVLVRKPEQDTSPNVFYIDGDTVSLDPLLSGATEAMSSTDVVRPVGTPSGHMVQVGYNAQHQQPWHWPVPAYLVTKGLGAGIPLVAMLGVFGLFEVDLVLALSVAVAALLATTGLLIADLEKPERFLRILTRPQWKSWLVRGGFLLIAFTNLVLAWLVAEWMELGGTTVFAVLAAPLAIGAAVYTAFLFWQCEGRDLWQSRALAPHLLVQAVMVGASFLTMLSDSPALIVLVVVAVLADLALMGLELFGKHSTGVAEAGAALMRGRFGDHVVASLILHLLALVVPPIVAFPTLLIALHLWEHAFVMAPQEVPNA